MTIGMTAKERMVAGVLLTGFEPFDGETVNPS